MKLDKITKDLQTNLFHYFQGWSDIRLCNFIHHFVYHNEFTYLSNEIENEGKLNEETRKDIENFLHEFDLNEAYVNYISDMRDPPKYFLRSKSSDLTMLETIRMYLLHLAYRNYSEYIKELYDRTNY